MDKKSKKMKIRIWLYILFSILLGTVVYAQNSTVNMSTYYPVPFGDFESLRLDPRGTDPGICGTDFVEGTLYVDSAGNIKICQAANWVSLGGGLWSMFDPLHIYPSVAADNIGIGTVSVSPGLKLQVIGDLYIDKTGGQALNSLTTHPSTLVVNGAGTGFGDLAYFQNYQGDARVVIDDTGHIAVSRLEGKLVDTYSRGDGPLNLNNFTTEDVIFADRNVGIGIAALDDPVTPDVPAGKLDVEGSLILSGSQDISLINSNDTALYRTGLAPGGTPPYPFDLEGNLVIQPMTTSDADIVFATRNGAGTTPVVAITKGASGSGMVIDTDYNGSYDAPSGGLIVAGDVGIGTTAPAYKLDVNGSVRFRPSAVEPAGANGAIYYKSAPTDKFRCYQKGGWDDCIQGGSVAQIKSGSVNMPCNGSGQVITFNTWFSSIPEVVITPGAGPFGAAYVDWWVDAIAVNTATLHVNLTGGGNCDVRWIATDAGNP